MLFGTDGIRGVVNEDLTPELAFKVGNALGRVFPGETVLIGRDTRASGEELEAALASGLASAGKEVLLCGVIPTPAVALLSSRMKTVGVVISASHNPPKYNGIKVIKNGFKLPEDEERRIEEILDPVKYVDYRSVGRIKRFDKAFEVYVGEILQMFPDLDLKGFEIAVDVANGASYRTTPLALEKLRAKVQVFANSPDGFNINDGCGSTNIDFLRSVKREGIVGFAHDGDADRVIFLDETGEEVHGDKMMGIAAEKMLDEGRLPSKKVVATILSNLGLEEFLRELGIELIRTKVGDKYVVEEMLKNGSNLGGERSGHIIFLDKSTTGDGLITALEILRILKKTGSTLKELHERIPDYPQVMVNVEVRDKSVAKDERVLKAVEREGEGVRIVVRPSGTEPVVRIMVEGKDPEDIEERARRIAEVVKEVDSERSSG